MSNQLAGGNLICISIYYKVWVVASRCSNKEVLHHPPWQADTALLNNILILENSYKRLPYSPDIFHPIHHCRWGRWQQLLTAVSARLAWLCFTKVLLYQLGWLLYIDFALFVNNVTRQWNIFIFSGEGFWKICAFDCMSPDENYLCLFWYNKSCKIQIHELYKRICHICHQWYDVMELVMLSHLLCIIYI